MPSQDPALRYDRASDLKGDDSLSEIARLIAPGATVLDLGAATGSLGKHLSESKQCTVDGVEKDPRAAALARPHYRKLLELDLESAALADHFPAGAYDAIVCADVLEHLREPGAVLDQLAALLVPGGRALLSIPNVGYAGVVAGLLSGEFKYRSTGLLDETHLRFFTRASLLELLGQHGLRAASIRPLHLPVHFSEFRDTPIETLTPAVLRALLSHPDALAYQFIVEALPGTGIAPAASQRDAGPRFAVQLYWSLEGRVEESQSTIASGVMGEERQSIELQIPEMAKPPSALRLDVGDRPGFVRLHALSLVDADGGRLWEWDGLLTSLRNPRDARVLAGPLAGSLLCTSHDPSVELPVVPETLARLQHGGRLHAELSWPLSSDYAFATNLLEEHERAWQAERKTLFDALERMRGEVRGEVEKVGTVRGEVPGLARAAAGAEVRDELRRFGVARGALPKLTRNSEKLQRTAASLEAQQAALQHQMHLVAARLEALERPSLLRRILGTARRDLLPAHVDFELVPSGSLQDLGGGQWKATDEDPHFQLRPRGNRIPAGWVLLEIDLTLEEEGNLSPQVYLDAGLGFSERNILRLPRPVDGRIEVEVRLPPELRALRFDPTDRPGPFRLSRVRMRELGKVRVVLRFAAPLAKNLVAHPREVPALMGRAWSIFRSAGLGGLREALIESARKTGAARYATWVGQFDLLTSADRAAIAARIQALRSRPRISVLMPVYNTPKKWLRRAIDSVREQLYPDWELCIADDASTAPHVRRMLERAAESDPRIKLAFRETNGHISAASNSALQLATGDFVALLDHDDELSPHALYMLAEEICAHPDAELIYSDEDKIDAYGGRRDPYFKPDWNPDLLSSQNYVNHLSCYRASLIRRTGGFREGLEGSQDFDLLLRATRDLAPERIRHVPHVLYHWRSVEGSTAVDANNKRYAIEAGLRALRERHPDAEVSEGPFPTTYRVRHPLPAQPPLVSLLVPTRDARHLVEQAVNSIFEKTTYPRFEIVIIDNQSRDPAALEYFGDLEHAGQARVLRYDAPFNYSAINNFAVREARGEVVCLLNNDVEVIEPEWLTELVSQALREGIGAVGCKLLYPDNTIQHAGVIAGLFGVGGHVFREIPSYAPGYFARAQLVQDLSICTAACLAIRRKTYLEVGGLDEEKLAVAFNDVDFCLRLVKAGYRNLYTPGAVLYHHESASRGHENTPEKKERFRREVEVMKQRWGKTLEQDPAYNPNLSLESLQMELAWPPRAARPWTTRDAAE